MEGGDDQWERYRWAQEMAEADANCGLRSLTPERAVL